MVEVDFKLLAAFTRQHLVECCEEVVEHQEVLLLGPLVLEGVGVETLYELEVGVLLDFGFVVEV